MATTHSMDLTKGSVFKKLLVFAFPLWLASLVQQLYHAADVIVVGKFAENSTTALAAVGSTSSVTSLILNLFIGLTAGASVRCANLYGAQDRRGLRKAMTTALISSAIGGVAVAVIGLVLSRPLLLLMGSPSDVIDQATVYMQIIFLGKPAVLLYNACSAIMRAHGESKRPMYILTATGLVNVALNLVLVIVFGMDVQGVAIATIVSQWLSAAVALYLLFHPEGEYRLQLSEFSFDKDEFWKIVRIGGPAGLNAIVFNLSNVVVISAVNNMGSATVAAVAAATSVSTLIYTLPSAFTTACISFSGQNYGAKRFDRIDKCLWSAIAIVETLFISANIVLTLFPEVFLRLYTDNPEVIRLAVPKMYITCWGYLIYTVSEIANGCQRGFGKSMGPTLLNIVCICGVRVAWVLFVFPHMKENLISLYICFPISWLCSAVAQMMSYYIARNKKIGKVKKKNTMDLTTGSVFKKLLIFAFPLCIANLLQQLYHSADMIVVGKFAADGVKSLAAVGATNSLTNLILHLFIGISAGATVLCANRVGANDKQGLRRLIHTAIPLSAVCGVIVGLIGVLMSPLFLDWMNCPSEIAKEATTYIRIIFLGQPANIIYNFGSGILRAHGDTKRPMYVLMITGMVNVLLNLLFVVHYHLDSAGVAIATIVAHYLSAAAILYMLFQHSGEYKMRISELRLNFKEIRNITKVGIPSGLNGIVYSFSNVIIVTAVNSLGKLSVAATSASTSVSAIAHVVTTGIATAAVSFAGQNYGAKNFKRIEKGYRCGIFVGLVFISLVSLAFTLFPSFFLGLYTDDKEVIKVGFSKLMLNNWGYLFCVVADMSNCCLRGMKHASGPTLANMLSVCVPRLIWTLVVFPFLPQKLGYLCIAYPVSWFLCAVTMCIYFYKVKGKEERKLALESSV